MNVFDLGTSLFQIGVSVYVLECLARLGQVPFAYRLGPTVSNVECSAPDLPGLAVARRDETGPLVYRVLSRSSCLFEAGPTGWLQWHFRIKGFMTVRGGQLRATGRVPLGPLLVVLGLGLALSAATVGFAGQGDVAEAAIAILMCAGALVPSWSFWRAEANRFPELTALLLAELATAVEEAPSRG